MMAHIKEASDTNFSEMYGPLFPSKDDYERLLELAF